MQFVETSVVSLSSPDHACEDACAHGPGALVVADGVGDWSKLGVDPGVTARFFAEHCLASARPDPVQRMREVHEAWLASAGNPLGTTTLGVAMICGAQTLQLAHIGDTYTFVVRENALVAWTRAQYTSYSVSGVDPRPVPNQIGRSEPGVRVFTADDAQVVVLHPVQRGDFVVMVTDGVLDCIDKFELHFYARTHQGSTDEFAQSVLKMLQQRQPGTRARDDATLVCGRIGCIQDTESTCPAV